MKPPTAAELAGALADVGLGATFDGAAGGAYAGARADAAPRADDEEPDGWTRRRRRRRRLRGWQERAGRPTRHSAPPPVEPRLEPPVEPPPTPPRPRRRSAWAVVAAVRRAVGAARRRIGRRRTPKH